jgi:hypothetical protein
MKRHTSRKAATLIVFTLGALALALLAPAAASASRSSSNHAHIECQNTVETDTKLFVYGWPDGVPDPNVIGGVRNPFYDDRGNQWSLYYDIRRDAVDNVACEMRLAPRIYNPSPAHPDGSWSGTVKILASTGGATVSSATHSGSGTYSQHFVWLGPWFGANPSSLYHLEIDEFNGSTVCSSCARAQTYFYV